MSGVTSYRLGPMEVASLSGSKYAMVTVDDFSSYTWADFLKEKSDAFMALFIYRAVQQINGGEI